MSADGPLCRGNHDVPVALLENHIPNRVEKSFCCAGWP